MYVTTTTTIEQHLPMSEEFIQIKVEHCSSDELCVKLKLGEKLDKWYEVEDIQAIVKALNKALNVRKDAVA